MLNREQTLKLSAIVREKLQAGNEHITEIRGEIGNWRYVVTFNPSTVKLLYYGTNGWCIDTGISAACLAYSPEYSVSYFEHAKNEAKNAFK